MAASVGRRDARRFCQKDGRNISIQKGKRCESVAENRPGIIVNFLIRAIVGMCMIFFVNEFLSSRGINIMVGMNPLSFLTSGTLGIPGVALLYGISFCQIL